MFGVVRLRLWFPHRFRTLFLLIVLLVSVTLGLNLKPVRADTASAVLVDSPSLVRAGGLFWVTVHGTYETANAMALSVSIKDRAAGHNNQEVGSGNSAIPDPGGVVTDGKWDASWIQITAYNPGNAEWDANNQYVWPLEADLVNYNSVQFSVTITKADADVYVKITDVYTLDSNGNKVNQVYVGSIAETIHVLWEFSVPANSGYWFRYKNSLGIYTEAWEIPGADGWIEGYNTNNQPWSESFESIKHVRAPLTPTNQWRWDFEVHVGTQAVHDTKDQTSLTLQVLDRPDRWAGFTDSSCPTKVLHGAAFSVSLNGAYVFPGTSSGAVKIDIVQQGGAPIPGGTAHFTPPIGQYQGSGQFSEIFTLTAPQTDGDLNLEARLWISGNPNMIDHMSLHTTVGATADQNYFIITDVKVNTPPAAPPQDVTYGQPFDVTLQVDYALNPAVGSGLLMKIWDWSGAMMMIASTSDTICNCFYPIPITYVIHIPGSAIPNRNGPWKLRAEALYWIPGNPFTSTPNGGQQFFQVNVVGAPGGGGGGTSDWAVTGISISPVEPFLGTDVTFTGEITVTTNDPLPQTVTVSCSLDGTELFNQPVTYQQGMTFLPVPSQPWTPTLGDHKIKWEVDPNHQYNDANPANNVMESTFTVSETPPLPPPSEVTPPPPPAGEEFDFYVTAVPTEQTVKSPVTYTVTVDTTAGTPQPVQLDLLGAPAGVSYLFSPPSGTPNYTSTLTVTTATSLPAGTYPLTVKASAAGKDRYKPLTLIVEKGPDYAISITPDSVQAKPGEKAVYTVTVSSDSGYGEAVNLMVSGLPQGATSRFEPSASTPTFQSTLTIELSKDVTPGFYRITVVGSGAEGKRITATLQVQGAAGGVESKATVDYLATAILGLIVAMVVVGGVLATRRLRRRRVKAFCIECGGKLAPGTEFCPKCGAKQTKSPQG